MEEEVQRKLLVAVGLKEGLEAGGADLVEDFPDLVSVVAELVEDLPDLVSVVADLVEDLVAGDAKKNIFHVFAIVNDFYYRDLIRINHVVRVKVILEAYQIITSLHRV